MPHIVGNAKDIYNAASSDLFEKLAPNAPLQQADIFVCGKPWGLNPTYNPHDPNSVQYFGHVGFVDQPMQGQSFLVSDAEINGSIGKRPSDWIAQAIGSPEWLTENDVVSHVTGSLVYLT